MRDATTRVIVLAIALLLWALVPVNPYGYYLFLRVAVCGVLAYLAWLAHSRGAGGWAFVFGFGAILYNPVLRVLLTREVWSVINVVTIIALVWFARHSAARELTRP